MKSACLILGLVAALVVCSSTLSSAQSLEGVLDSKGQQLYAQFLKTLGNNKRTIVFTRGRERQYWQSGESKGRGPSILVNTFVNRLLGKRGFGLTGVARIGTSGSAVGVGGFYTNRCKNASIYTLASVSLAT